MDWQLFVGIGCCALLVGVILWDLAARELRLRKNPHLAPDFMVNLSDRNIVVSEKLQLELSFDIFLHMKVYAKNSQGEFVTVESRSCYRPINDIIKFQDPWHDEIAACLKKIYHERFEEKQQQEEKQQMEIQAIKNNWHN